MYQLIATNCISQIPVKFRDIRIVANKREATSCDVIGHVTIRFLSLLSFGFHWHQPTMSLRSRSSIPILNTLLCCKIWGNSRNGI